MKSLFPIALLVAGLAVPAGAQDQTVKSKTKIKGDDARSVTLSGCLQQSGGDAFVLQGATTVSGDEARMKSKVKTEVDDDDVKVQSKAKTEIDGDDDDARVGTSGVATTYELTPHQGVDLASHVGHRVQITAVALDAATSDDDDAKVKVKDETKVERENAPDAKVKSKSKAELPRGANPRMVAMAITHIGPCQP